MKLTDIVENLSDHTAGLAGRKPKPGETWVHKDGADNVITINKIDGRTVYYSPEGSKAELDMGMGAFRFTYKITK